MVIFFNFSLTLNYFHPLQVKNCDSNSRLVVDEDDNGKFRPERVNPYTAGTNYIRFFAFFTSTLAVSFKHVENKTWHQSTGSENSLSNLNNFHSLNLK